MVVQIRRVGQEEDGGGQREQGHGAEERGQGGFFGSWLRVHSLMLVGGLPSQLEWEIGFVKIVWGVEESMDGF